MASKFKKSFFHGVSLTNKNFLVFFQTMEYRMKNLFLVLSFYYRGNLKCYLYLKMIPRSLNSDCIKTKKNIFFHGYPLANRILKFFTDKVVPHENRKFPDFLMPFEFGNHGEHF